ncbi:MAG: porin family protein [Paraprevotella sp.]|nr:porin family protein [Paraprevotella sp.]
MKKIVMTLLAVLAMTTAAQAQFRVGGSVSFWYENGDGPDITSFTLAPELAYELNEKWEVGGQLGIAVAGANETGRDNALAFSVTPYGRYTFYRTGKLSLYCDGLMNIAAGNATESDLQAGSGASNSDVAFAVGLRPGVAYRICPHWGMQASLGFLGFSANDGRVAGGYRPGFGVSLSNTLSLGVFYHF